MTALKPRFIPTSAPTPTRALGPATTPTLNPTATPAGGPSAAPIPTPTPGPTPAPEPTPTLPSEPTPTGAGWEGFGNGVSPSASWRPYAASSPFNTSAAGSAVVSQSSAMVSRVLQWGQPGNVALGVSETSSDFMHPVYYAQPTDPVYTLHATEAWGNDPIDGMQIRIPAGARPAGGSDGHMTVITPEGWEYDFWRVSSIPAGGGTMNFAWGGRLRVDGNGLGGESTAANFGLMAGAIRPQELESGEINHALFIVLKCTSKTTEFGFGTKAPSAGDSGGSYVYPASKGGSRCSGESETNVPPMGTRFTYAMSEEQIAALSVPAWKKTILRALAKYGAYVGDTGGPGVGLQFESGSSYTSQGRPDPWVEFGKKNNLPTWEGHYIMHVAEGVNWQNLRVVAPPSAS